MNESRSKIISTHGMNEMKFNIAEREVLHSVPGKSVHILVGGLSALSFLVKGLRNHLCEESGDGRRHEPQPCI